MTQQHTPRPVAGEKKDREALSLRMYYAIVDELAREDNLTQDDIFLGRGARHVLLGAIADLTTHLIICTAYAVGKGNWREMVSEVHGEMLKWVHETDRR
ncbi:MAG TPA: hypothetical protein VH519_13580 [Hyphomicrobiaceae bacterium]|jgi:hypothetical protein